MNTDIVIIGCGSTGEATAAWFTLRGKRVALCDTERFGPEMETIRRREGLLLRGNAGVTGRALPALLTTDFGQALAASRRVLICVPASRHEEIARLCLPHLTPEHCLLITPGNMGSPLFRAVFAEEEGRPAGKALVAEMSDNLWACRATGPAEVLVALPMREKRVAAFPARDTARALAAVTDLSARLLRETPPGFELFVALDGPGHLKHRYIEEDALCGMALLTSVAGVCGVDAPVTSALLCLAGCFNGRDYRAMGRTLDNLGLAGLSPSELLSRLD